MGDQRDQLRVLHVVASTDRRGAETAALSLAAALGQLDWPGQVVALAPGSVGGLEVPVLGPSRYSPRSLIALRQRVRSSRVVIAHGSSTLPAVASVTRATRVPFVYRSIGDPRAWVTNAARKARVRASVSRASALVALWRGAAVTWHEDIGVPPERITVIPNGSDPQKFRPQTSEERTAARESLGLQNDTPVVLYLGALTAEKRPDLALRAVLALPGTVLLMVGSGPEERGILKLADSLAEGRTLLLNSTDHPETPLAAADVLVLPSDTEGMPAVAIEAGLSGVPVVATDVGAVSEIVQAGQSGILVERGDLAGITSAIETCLSLREEMGTFARNFCETRFDTKRLAPEWRDLLLSVVS